MVDNNITLVNVIAMFVTDDDDDDDDDLTYCTVILMSQSVTKLSYDYTTDG